MKFGIFNKTLLSFSMAIAMSSAFASDSWWEYSERYADKAGIISSFEAAPSDGRDYSRISLTIRAEPRSRVSVLVRPYGKSVAMSETSPGVFEGIYIMGQGERFERTTLAASVVKGGTKSEAFIENPVLVRKSQSKQTTNNDFVSFPEQKKNYSDERQKCNYCAVVESITENIQQQDASAPGVVIGGIVGGILGNQIGKGHGRDLATIAGIAGGAYAGNEVAKNQNQKKEWIIRLRMESGTYETIRTQTPPSFNQGDLVEYENGSIRPARHRNGLN